MAKGPEAFRTISEAAEETGLAAHVLRFWETKFTFIRPVKGSGGRRFYRPSDIIMLNHIRRLLHEQGHSIREVQTLHRENRLQRPPTPPATGMNEPGRRSRGLSMDPDTLGRLAVALRNLESSKIRLDALLPSC